MRYLLVLAFATVAFGGTILPNEGIVPQPITNKVHQHFMNLLNNNGEIDIGDEETEDVPVEVGPQFILSWQARRAIRKLRKEMPCGFPQYGIPPLAPLKMRELNFHFEKSILETFDKLFRFRVDGLDDFRIKKFKLNMIKSKITFDFIFKNVKASATKYETDTILDALRQLGLSVEYEGDGSLEFGLRNLRIAGVLKYKMPILWGSIRVTSLKTTISLQKCESNIEGFMGDGSTNQMINRQIENIVEKGINNNQQAISDMIEDNLVPRVNKMLKGNDFWTIIDIIFGSSEGDGQGEGEGESEDDPIVTKCVPPEDPWA